MMRDFNIVPQYATGRWLRDRRENAHQYGFARAVGPEKAEYTRPERKLYFAECLYYLPSTAMLC